MSAAWDLSVDVLDLASFERPGSAGTWSRLRNGVGELKTLLSQLFLTSFPLETAVKLELEWDVCISAASGQAVVAQPSSADCQGFLSHAAGVSMEQLLATARDVFPLPSHPTALVLPLACTGSSTWLISSLTKKKKYIYMYIYVWQAEFILFRWFSELSWLREVCLQAGELVQRGRRSRKQGGLPL